MNNFKKTLASILIVAQLVIPAIADAGQSKSKRFIGAVLAGMLDTSSSTTMDKAHGDLEAAKRAIAGKTELSSQDIVRYVDAMRPYINYVNGYDKAKNAGVVPNASVPAQKYDPVYLTLGGDKLKCDNGLLSATSCDSIYKKFAEACAKGALQNLCNGSVPLAKNEAKYSEADKNLAVNELRGAFSALTGKRLKEVTGDVMVNLGNNPLVQDLIKATPIVGSGIAMWELSKGKDFFTDQKLNAANQVLAWASLVPGEGTVARMLGNSSSMILTALKTANRAVETGNVVESNSAQASSVWVDDTVFGGKNVTQSFYDKLDKYAQDITTPTNVSIAIRDVLTKRS